MREEETKKRRPLGQAPVKGENSQPENFGVQNSAKGTAPLPKQRERITTTPKIPVNDVLIGEQPLPNPGSPQTAQVKQRQSTRAGQTQENGSAPSPEKPGAVPARLTQRAVKRQDPAQQPSVAQRPPQKPMQRPQPPEAQKPPVQEQQRPPQRQVERRTPETIKTPASRGSATVANRIIGEHKQAVAKERPRVQERVPLKMAMMAEKAGAHQPSSQPSPQPQVRSRFAGAKLKQIEDDLQNTKYSDFEDVSRRQEQPAREQAGQSRRAQTMRAQDENIQTAPERRAQSVQQIAGTPEYGTNMQMRVEQNEGVQKRPVRPRPVVSANVAMEQEKLPFLYPKLTPNYSADIIPANKYNSANEEPNFRHELKYYISMADYAIARQAMKALLRPDENADETGKYLIRSLYFDDYEETALVEKMAGNLNRAKYRIRIYNCSDKVIRFEKKIKHGPYIAKKSIRLTRAECDRIISGDYAGLLLREEPLAKEIYLQMATNGLTPRRVVDYEREAYVLNFENIRITFDLGLKAGRMIGNLFDPNMPTMTMLHPGKAVLEVKFDKSIPTYIKNILASMQYEQRSSVSKYVICRMFD